VVIASKKPRGFSGESEFVIGALLKSDGKSSNGLGRLSRHGRNDDAGIDASAQEGAKRNVGNHAQANRFVNEFTQLLPWGGFGQFWRGLGRGRRKLPESALCEVGIAIEGQPTGRRQFPDGGKR